MNELAHWIDELIEKNDLTWHRDGNQVCVTFAKNGRSQIVHLRTRRKHYVFSSVVAGSAEVKEDRRKLWYRLWRRNSLKPIVTFTIDNRDRVVGLIDQPIESVSEAEICFYIETVARECDRLEYILTGSDIR
ncbi:MAG: hypothetical protein F4X44_02695 [Gammaproteobacteria bacterium]|nr:hypothetical protein [Gammaproteobacteria bacterium]